ncbi:MAG: TIGR00266 family protein [Chloroflexi bacterium]|nr:TIGR00266 family protein [Chloroflexota bacterium]
METEILYRPSYSLAVLKLAPNEEVRVEGGSMVSMTQGIALETRATGGLLKSLARSVLGGESFFQNTYKAPPGGGELSVAPSLPGDLFVLTLQNESLLVQSGAYVASEMSANLDTAWGGAKTFFASEGLIMLRASGSGKLVLSSYGAIHEKNLGPSEVFTVDTGHLVAFTEKIGFNVRRVGGMKVDAFLSWLIPKLPKQGSSG